MEGRKRARRLLHIANGPGARGLPGNRSGGKALSDKDIGTCAGTVAESWGMPETLRKLNARCGTQPPWEPFLCGHGTRWTRLHYSQ